MNLKRRRLLLAGATLVMIPPAGYGKTAAAATGLARPVSLERMIGRVHIHAIGCAYLQKFPDENDAARLCAAITADIGAGETLTRLLQRQTRREFARGNTVQLHGWVLARTEARQSALYSLLYP